MRAACTAAVLGLLFFLGPLGCRGQEESAEDNYDDQDIEERGQEESAEDNYDDQDIEGQEEIADDNHDDQDIEESLSAEQLRRMHAKFDANGDGKASLQEVMAYAAEVGNSIARKDIGAILEEIDASKDGKLTLEEHLNDIHNQADGGDEEEMKELEQRKKVESAKFMAADMNGDQMLDASELPALFYPEMNESVLSVTVQEAMRQKDANADGKLTPNEFWVADPEDGDEGELSEEDNSDFAKLDVDGDGALDMNELRAWESGRFRTAEAMKKLIEMADKDSDMHITADELTAAWDQIATSDAQYHLIEWVKHHEL